MTSKYFLSLTDDSRKRYLEKLSFIGGHDPLDTSLPGWGENSDHFPNLTYIDMVNYLVFGSAPCIPISSLKTIKVWKPTIVSYLDGCKRFKL